VSAILKSLKHIKPLVDIFYLFPNRVPEDGMVTNTFRLAFIVLLASVGKDLFVAS